MQKWFMHLVDDGKRVLARNFINNLKFLDARHYYPNIHMHTTQCTKNEVFHYRFLQ